MLLLWFSVVISSGIGEFIGIMGLLSGSCKSGSDMTLIISELDFFDFDSDTDLWDCDFVQHFGQHLVKCFADEVWSG